MPDDGRTATDPPQEDQSREAGTSETGPALALVGSYPTAPVTSVEVAPVAGPVLTGVAFVGSVALAAETVRAASAGEKTPIDVADEYYSTHFGDIYGWIKGDYTKKVVAQQKQQQLKKATKDAQKLTNSSADDPKQDCPLKREPVMPGVLSAVDQELWRECNSMYRQYKQTQQTVASLSSRIGSSLDDLANNRPMTLQDKLELCNLLDELIKATKRLHKQRKTYVDSGCDKFDWYNEGKTEGERRTRHLGELRNVDKQIKNLYESWQRYCNPEKTAVKPKP